MKTYLSRLPLCGAVGDSRRQIASFHVQMHLKLFISYLSSFPISPQGVCCKKHPGHIDQAKPLKPPFPAPRPVCRRKLYPIMAAVPGTNANYLGEDGWVLLDVSDLRRYNSLTTISPYPKD